MTTDGMVCSGGGAHGGGGGSGGGSGSACIAGGCGRGHQQLTWEKLSPEEFQHLQDFAACKHFTQVPFIAIPSKLYQMIGRRWLLVTRLKSN